MDRPAEDRPQTESLAASYRGSATVSSPTVAPPLTASRSSAAATPHKPVGVVIGGQPLSIDDVAAVSRARGPAARQAVSVDPGLEARMQPAVDRVAAAVAGGEVVYGVTTGFGGMVDIPIEAGDAEPLQTNLLAFLAAGAGEPIDSRHTRAAMLLRASVLARGCSGIRTEFVRRMARFLQADAVPVVRELGSIGASGDLVPLSTVARAISGQAGRVSVELDGTQVSGDAALDRLGFERIALRPKEGLALVNGTSFSSAIAAGVVFESRRLLALAIATQGLLLRALLAHEAPFEAFVHAMKPHPGQQWVAREMASLLADGRSQTDRRPATAQDRYSIRCLPQYLGPLVETLGRVGRTVEIEMNAVSDNPLIDTADAHGGKFYQSGNFLGQYVAIAMDDVRRVLALTAKHLDVQIASVVAPEFSGGLPPSLRGSDARSYNMGLKGLQITGNAIVPMLTHAAAPLTEHYPTHAEQFNQNVNGLSWGSATMAWQSVKLMRQYLGVSLLMAVQAVDLRARNELGHCDGRGLLGSRLAPLYDAVYAVLGRDAGEEQPLMRNDLDVWLEDDLARLAADIAGDGHLDGHLISATAGVAASMQQAMSECGC